LPQNHQQIQQVAQGCKIVSLSLRHLAKKISPWFTKPAAYRALGDFRNVLRDQRWTGMFMGELPFELCRLIVRRCLYFKQSVSGGFLVISAEKHEFLGDCRGHFSPLMC
jgi:hypothetical protein